MTGAAKGFCLRREAAEAIGAAKWLPAGPASQARQKPFAEPVKTPKFTKNRGEPLNKLSKLWGTLNPKLIKMQIYSAE